MPERRPFDPARIRQPSARARSADAPLSVSQLNDMVRAAIAMHVPATVAVAGEIGDLTRAGSGHLYFTLKDAHSEIRCVLWRSAGQRLRFEPTRGMDVLAIGAVEVYAPRGAYQLIVRSLEPRGVGALEIALRQLREKLAAEGLLDPARKRPLPHFPQRIGVVTSPRGAALRDILHTLARRFPACEVVLAPTRVQGEGAAAEIAAAIALLNAHADAIGGVDVLIVGRGGGSLEDLWAFNEEVVARAIAASGIPVISAVGHEIDVSISDLVADVRAPTPTAAAELAAPSAEEVRAALTQQLRRATRAAAYRLHMARSRLDLLAASELLSRPLTVVQQRAQQVDELAATAQRELATTLTEGRRRLSEAASRLHRFGAGAAFLTAGRRVDQLLARAAARLGEQLIRDERRLAGCAARVARTDAAARLARGQQRVEQVLARLDLAARLRLMHGSHALAARLAALHACDPRRVLRRGYSVTRDARSGAVIRSVDAVRDGQRLTTELVDGTVESVVVDPKQPRLFDP